MWRLISKPHVFPTKYVQCDRTESILVLGAGEETAHPSRTGVSCLMTTALSSAYNKFACIEHSAIIQVFSSVYNDSPQLVRPDE